ncbi:hypothetical protein [Microcoleus sp. bin38.metabat.b11b12b14.051]|uniref:hypothetical protein n=1 Tax=Microcoleus sp. bin38.metabat.b11b12b14.051 TaxID=2742709 RepID=UPI0025DF69DE|nr:hypothetical protein [Microcoleus sp. bin38.metabat.b11b12b14.051]
MFLQVFGYSQSAVTFVARDRIFVLYRKRCHRCRSPFGLFSGNFAVIRAIAIRVAGSNSVVAIAKTRLMQRVL